MRRTRPRDLDTDCLRRLAEGDVSILDVIWHRHADRAYRHALWMTGQPGDAEDVVQTVFLRLAGLGGNLLQIRNLGSYLGTMVHREAVEASRRRAERDGHAAPDPESLLAAEADPDADVDRRRLAALVAELPTDQREVVVLHLWNDFTFREIGRMLGISPFTAASRYRLATARLRRAITRGSS